MTTDWQVGSPVSWDGEFNGKQYSDKGEVLTVEPGKRLVVTHFSPLMGKPDAPENYHTVSYTLSPSDAGTRLELVQDNAGSAEEAEHSSGTWQTMLDGLKTLAEKS